MSYGDTRDLVLQPVCSGCGLIRGAGFPSSFGGIAEPDPAPDDPGLDICGMWFCTQECLDYYLDECRRWLGITRQARFQHERGKDHPALRGDERAHQGRMQAVQDPSRLLQ